LSGRGLERRIQVVDEFDFPASVRQRFAHHHSSLTTDEIRLVESGARQWFRLIARKPGSRLAMASVAVDDLWHEMVLHTHDYARFCDQAFGRFLHHQPETAMTTADARANQSTRLLRTLRLARRDENCSERDVPLLFRVDAEFGLPRGRRYLADCGGGSYRCFPAKDMICLQHLTGVRKKKSEWGHPGRPHGRRNRLNIDDIADGIGDAGDGGGGGCGSP
jgi:hypothetical protein